MKVIVKAKVKTWFLDGDPSVAEFIQPTPVEVIGPGPFGWYKTKGLVPGFPSGKVICLKDEDFDIS